ncbi:NUDIX hydrolase [Candidatus Woesearchaeota archaeon]|nr:NUDIX hydrolase [Candidatus Woesearchaeota archaeon]
MIKKQFIVVLGLIENDKGQVLVSQRVDPKVPEAHMKWDIPGGKIDFGEDIKDAVVREILEETGLDVEVISLVPHAVSMVWKHDDYLQHTLVFCYDCRLIGGELHLDDHRINDLKWVEPKDLLSLDLLPTTREFAQRYIAGLKD